MKEPRAFALCGDWHGNTPWGMKAIETVGQAGGDAILHLGDYGFTFDKSFVKGIEKSCAENDVMLYFVDGNHDWHEYLWSLPEDKDGLGVLSDHVRYIPRGYRWAWWGLTFMALGGATSVDKDFRKPFTEWWPTEAITTRDVNKAIEGGNVDVMIAHDCPSGVPIPGISFEQGVKYFPAHSLREADSHREIMRGVVDVVRPKLYVHGHYHICYRYEDNDTIYQGLNMDDTENNIWLVRSPVDLIDTLVA